MTLYQSEKFLFFDGFLATVKSPTSIEILPTYMTYFLYEGSSTNDKLNLNLVSFLN